MKRYWKISTLTVFIIVVLTAFFMQSSFALTNQPEFTIQHESGDKKLGDQLVVEGSYSGEVNQMPDDLTITGKGSTYLEPDFSSGPSGVYLNPEIKQLQKNYRSFMRGKTEMINNYYESSDYLVYTDIDFDTEFTGFAIEELYFNIDVLEKESGNRETFELALPADINATYLDVRRIYFDGHNLNVVTNVSFFDNQTGKKTDEMHVFSIDVQQQKINNDELIVSNEEIVDQEDSRVDFQVVERADTDGTGYIVFEKNTLTNVSRENGNLDHGEEKSDYVAYHLDSKEQTSIELPENIKTGSGIMPIQTVDDHLLFPEVTDDELVIHDYNLSSDTFEKNKHYDLPEDRGENVFFTIEEDYVMIANQTHPGASGATILIYDYTSGEQLYKGSIEMIDQTPGGQDELFIYDITLD